MSIEPTTQKKSQHWCGTVPSNDPNEEDQTPVAVTMPAFPKGTRHYPCITQDGLMPTFGGPPHDDGDRRPENDGDAIVVGVRELIPRWTANKESPTKLLYFVVPDGFASDADRQ